MQPADKQEMSQTFFVMLSMHEEWNKAVIIMFISATSIKHLTVLKSIPYLLFDIED